MSSMDFKTGLIVGAALGYVLGTKAGRNRYEQLLAVWERAAENPAVADIAAATEGPRQDAMRLLGDGMRSFSEILRKQTEAR